MKRLLFLFLLVGCQPAIISMEQLPDYLGREVIIQGSFFDVYNDEYLQFADESTYIYVKTNGTFVYRRWYTLKGKVEMCQISSSKERVCLNASSVE